MLSFWCQANCDHHDCPQESASHKPGHVTRGPWIKTHARRSMIFTKQHAPYGAPHSTQVFPYFCSCGLYRVSPLIQTSFLTSNSGHGPFPPLFLSHSVAVFSETDDSSHLVPVTEKLNAEVATLKACALVASGAASSMTCP